MKYYHKYLGKKIFTSTFDEDKGEGDKGEGDKDKDKGEGDKTFTQVQVNSMMANLKTDVADKARKENKTLLEQVKLLQTKTNLSTEEKEKYETTILDLEKRAFSVEELADRDKKKLETTHLTAVDTLTGERDLWRGRFTEATIHRSITDAAQAKEAYNTSQIVALLQPATTLVEVKNEAGDVTGLTPQVAFNDKDKDGNPVVLNLSPEKAVELMKEKPEYGNLFKGKHIGGLGGTNESGQITPTLKKATSSLTEYRKNREKILNGEIK